MRLSEVKEKPRFCFWAALANAALVFLLVYGTLGGVLSAYDCSYNAGLCMFALFALALVLSAAYETGKKWIQNLVSILVFLLYVYIAIRSFWTINSGYYAVVNHIFKEARDFLGISNGMEYALVVDNESVTVTVFALFIGMVGIILCHFQLQHKASLLRTVLQTLPFYLIPLYFEKSPDTIHIMFLFTGYVAVGALCGGNIRTRMSGQMRMVLPLAAAVSVVCIRLAMLLIPQTVYESAVPASEMKIATQDKAAAIAQFGFGALFGRRGTGAGISGGRLSLSSTVMPDYETDLIVRYTPYNYEPVYLKAFTGKDYEGDRWTNAGADGDLRAEVQSRKAVYEEIGAAGEAAVESVQAAEEGAAQGRGVMEVENVGAAAEYEYCPYYTDYESVSRRGQGTAYVYYPPVARVAAGEQIVSKDYLTVPDRCLSAVHRVCSAAGFSGAPDEIAEQIVSYFRENYSYTLRPGYYFGNPDYISHFLLNSKKGYCAHFASAATMLFRYMGIPARYAEGYAFTYQDIVLNGGLVEDAVYTDYYSGYSPIGETALIEIEIPDAKAHAWVEIYIEGEGWVVVDPTPAAEQEEPSSFWEDFFNGGTGEDLFEQGGDILGAYVKNAVVSMVYVFYAAIAGGALVYMVRRIIRIRRERRLPEEERVKLEYRRLTARLLGRNQDFAAMRTIKEQLDFLKERYELPVTDTHVTSLYKIFFAKEKPPECGRLRKELVRMRRKIRFAREKRR